MGLIRFLTASQILRMHYTHIFPLSLDVDTRQQSTSRGVANPLLQPSYLESALASPLNHHYYSGTTNIFHLAALVAEKLALNHPFYDGNKRTALFSMDMFLRLNGRVSILALQSTLERRSKIPGDAATAHPATTTAETAPAEELSYTDQGLAKLSLEEQAIADAMVNVATGQIHGEELSSLIMKTALLDKKLSRT
ncbi:hypothetical protein F5Y14DRAFT_156859 [Nemania sp. NC0429]|nr:hypothetical protein F5Y14DRAFT_156859 [Nemania sp. NC0429]